MMKAIIRRLRKLEDVLTPDEKEPITLALQFVDSSGTVVDTKYFELLAGARPHRPRRAARGD